MPARQPEQNHRSLMDTDKKAVHDYWNAASCGEVLYLKGEDEAAYRAQGRKRYELEPYIESFANFTEAAGRTVLEIGVGLGADHEQFAINGAHLVGVDLTARAVEHTRKRLAAQGLSSHLQVADAENLPFADGSFDVVYSWGVLHHSPNTHKAIDEVRRVVRTGGDVRIMVYHKHSMVGYMLWIRYGLLTGRPWRSLSSIYAEYLESPGTKAYSVAEVRKMFSAFSEVKIRTVLTHGDLLESDAGQRHGGLILSLARKIWPRRLIRWLFPNLGLFMLIEAKR